MPIEGGPLIRNVLRYNIFIRCAFIRRNKCDNYFHSNMPEVNLPTPCESEGESPTINTPSFMTSPSVSVEPSTAAALPVKPYNTQSNSSTVQEMTMV